jgi:predicted glycoside hydrolase/deacetylase ChbG (UPF0249 family)
MKERYLIVNADDFGQSAGINRGIIDAHERGIVSSASLMVRWPAAGEAAAYAHSHRSLSLGLHFDFGEWCYRDGDWLKLYEVVSVTDVEAVKEEARRQLAEFRRLMECNPTHLDSHQHVHRRSALEPFFVQLAGELNVPLRGCAPEINHHGGFYGQDEKGNSFPEFIQAPALIKTIHVLPQGYTELGCHPGYAADLNTMYRDERAIEIETLRNPDVRSALAANGVELRSFGDSAAAAGGLS